MKDKADIFRVYGSGEVVEERFAPVSSLTAERLHEECLGETGREEIEGLEYLIGVLCMKQSLCEMLLCFSSIED